MFGSYAAVGLVTGLLLPIALGVTLLVLAGRAVGAAGLVRTAAILIMVLPLLSLGITPVAMALTDPITALTVGGVVRSLLTLVTYGLPVILLLVALRKVSRPRPAGTLGPRLPYGPNTRVPGPQWPTPGHGPGHGPPPGQDGPPGPPVQGHPFPEGPPPAQGPHGGPPHRPHPGQNPPPGR
ncbi:hypothetical protein ACFW3Z_18930 [Nocardiopsis alba]|jgi:hypothetical protein|uniref:hypothetical protein n=1 Tax=Nocardiopsis alba TaxID=53437 RepID=UPI0033BF6F2D